jgi:thioredoxin 1
MNNLARIAIVALVAAGVAAAIVLKQRDKNQSLQAGAETSLAAGGDHPFTSASKTSDKPLPKLLDLGAGKCIPCKLMAPILEELKQEYAGRMEVEFIDVWENQQAAKAFGVETIPTQIFFDAEGRELFRHTGFYGREDILARWQELGVDVQGGKAASAIVRESPATADTRPRESTCFMCDGEVNPQTRTVVKGETEQRTLCSPHCYFIYLSSIPGADFEAEAAKVRITDWSSGEFTPATSATYLYGLDSKGRPTIRAFASREAADQTRQTAPGTLIGWELIRSKELATRCGFCDRAVYPEDACKVTVGSSTHTYGCCTHCAMGVAARTGKDIDVEAYDGLTGETIRVRTLNGSIASLEPTTAVAWFGQKKIAEGKWVSAGCFKQGFFVSQDNLKKWLEEHPTMTGREITIAQALADKMKLSPEQIAKACKLGECK